MSKETPSLTHEIQPAQDLKGTCMEMAQSLQASDLPAAEKRLALYHQCKAYMTQNASYINVQVGDNDLIGNKFNGHNLHLLLQAKGLRSFHLVTRKLSEDATTSLVRTDAAHNFAEELLFQTEFLLADMVHLHLIHNTNFDIQYLPMLTKLKPMVLTLHDPFFLGGHCVHSGDCEKYKSFCTDCEHLQIHFALKEDLTSYYFMKKSVAIQNSNLPVIVASQWMEERVKASPIFAHQKIYRLPFGIDLDVFCPRDCDTAKKALGIPQESLTIMFRADVNPFKGLEVVLNALDKITSDRPITLISVGQNNLLNEYKQKYPIFEFGWIAEDKELAKLYQACDVFLMPSRQEAFGMMAIEAMACAKPVLGLEGTALPAVVHSPECGLAVCEAEFANTLQFWLEHPQECLERGKKSLAYAQAHYGIEQYTDGMLRIYAEVMASFTPDPHAETVLSQMLQASLAHASCADKATSLSDSHSWRLTKPLRALKHALHSQNHKHGGRIADFRAYMKNAQCDRRDNEIIQNSFCWKLTKPIRVASSAAGKIKKKLFHQ